MALLPEYEKYHSLGPKDVGIRNEPAPMLVEIARQTNRTGEQITIKVPVYGDESRAVLHDRLQMAYSVLQDRMEDENKAVNWQNRRLEIQRRAAEKLRRKEIDHKKSLEGIEKEARRLRSLIKNPKAPNKAEAEKQLEHLEVRKKELWENYKAEMAPFMKLIEHAKMELDQNKELPYTGPTLEELLKDNPDAEPDIEAAGGKEVGPSLEV